MYTIPDDLFYTSYIFPEDILIKFVHPIKLSGLFHFILSLGYIAASDSDYYKTDVVNYVKVDSNALMLGNKRIPVTALILLNVTLEK